MVSERAVREAWLRAEAQCECRKAAHGPPFRCTQFLIWAERGETGRGAWEARPLDDPRKPPCEILCAACYAKAMGRSPMGSAVSTR
jgi:hypothetical protein